MEPLKLRPAYKDYIWGGTRLETEFGKESGLERTAESWELSCHDAGQSTIINSVYKGMTLRAYLEQDWTARVGHGAGGLSNFPVLVKFIDAASDLSIQVHPDDRFARENENGENGKTECWYVVDAEPGAALAYGFNHNVTKEELVRAIETNALLDHIQMLPVRKGDVLFIEPGTLHAIGAGILIAEIQQNSNITYRVYDYNRKDADGNTRELHLEKALAVLKMRSAPPRLKRPATRCEGGSYTVIADCPYFTTTELHIAGEIDIPAANGASYTHLLCVDGEGALLYDDGVVMPIERGDSIFLPANFGAFQLRSTDCTLLCTQTLPRK